MPNVGTVQAIKCSAPWMCFEAGGFAQTQSSVKGVKRVVTIGIFTKPFDSKWMSGHFFKVGQIVIKKIEWDRR